MIDEKTIEKAIYNLEMGRVYELELYRDGHHYATVREIGNYELEMGYGDCWKLWAEGRKYPYVFDDIEER